ncbi:MAG: glycosyltransferase family 1 protein [Zetaproteobacteria bacterium]|nr:MAG: glycosyltransferase family 1 protein [Zetaproteobacteria bacterium]
MHIGLVYNWPNTKTSELDLIGRMKAILQRQGHIVTIIDPFGKIMELDGSYRTPMTMASTETFDFVLNLHYTNPNLLGTVSYMVNWNPMKFLTHHPTTGEQNILEEDIYLSSCQQSHDVLLSAGSDDVDAYSDAINLFNPTYLGDTGLRLHTSCQVFDDIPDVDLSNFCVFYIGVNWERLKRKGGTRHKGLLERLDETGDVHFYGVREVYGVKVWEGFRHYQGELPFDDGRSIVETANRCGVSLVLSSESHLESGLVSTRIFQACAAKTVVIADDNPFIVKHFGDSVLTFERSDDPLENAERIIQLINWIKEHPEEAAEKARRAHEIFVERFSLDAEIERLVDGHARVLKRIRERCLPKEGSNKRVDVIHIQKTLSRDDVRQLIENVNRQRGVDPHVIVIHGPETTVDVQQELEQHAHFPFTVMRKEAVAFKCEGELVMNVLDNSDARAFCFHQSSVWWSPQHLGFMLRCMEDTGNPVVQSAFFVRNDILMDEYNQRLAMLLVWDGIHPFNRNVAIHRGMEGISIYPPSCFLFDREVVLQHRAQYAAGRVLGMGFYLFLVAMALVVSGRYPEYVPRFTSAVILPGKHLLSRDWGRGPQVQDEMRKLALIFRCSPLFREQDYERVFLKEPRSLKTSLMEHLSHFPRVLHCLRVLRAMVGRFKQ